jgi:hypothetical protein
MQVPLNLPSEETPPETLILLIHHPQQASASLSLELAFLESPCHPNKIAHYSDSTLFLNPFIPNIYIAIQPLLKS